MSGQPGSFQPKGEDWLVREVQTLRREMNELRAANPFGPMGIKPVTGGFNVTGTMGLPAGSISNAALAAPLQTATASNGVTNYAITTVSTVRASVTLTVPAGFTQAIIIANATAMGTNSGAAADYLYVSAVVQAVNGGELYSSAAAGLGVGIAAPFNPTLTGLASGQLITVGVATRAGTAAWAAVPANQASIAATAIFLK
jgi:hypothetical protein